MTANELRALLLEGAGEEEFTQHVKRVARRYGWRGIHTRYSEAVLESLHTRAVDGYSEAFGQPDWFFWHEGREESFFAELKGASGRLSKYQKPMITSLRKAGLIVFEWWPRDHEIVEQVFRYGPHV